MEEKKQLKSFGVFEIPKTEGEFLKTPLSERSRGSTKIINTNETCNVNIGKGVVIHLSYPLPSDIAFHSDKGYSYYDIIKLDKDYPNLIEGFTPPLYKEFIVKGNLLNHVQVGQYVKINPKYKDDRTSEYKLKDIYFKSLNDMTVLVAKLDNEDIVLYNRLQLCK